MNSSTKQLAERGKYLRNAAPREFEGFYEAFRAFVDGAAYDMVQILDQHELLRAQGRVQQSLKLLKILEEIKND